MRLASLTLERYGNFERQTVRFDPRPGRLSVVMAPNGAGKSVLRRAFGDLLFGIGGQSPMGFRYGYSGMRLLAEMRDAEGASLQLVRRKGHGGTLHDACGQEFGAAAMARLIGPMDARRLGQLFALDTERLREGGRELLETGGDLAEALLSASSGLRRARDLDRDFAAARDALAPRGRKVASRPFYRALDSLVDARKARRQEILSPQAWEQHRRALDEAAARVAEAEAEVAAVSVAVGRLQRIRLTRPLLRQHDAAAAWLDGHRDAPVLPASLGADLAAVRERLFRAEDRERGARAVLGRHQEALERLSPDLELLERDGAIDALSAEAAQVRQIEGDLPDIVRRLVAEEQRCTLLLRDLGADVGHGEAALLLPGPPLLAEAQGLLDRHVELANRLRELPDDLDRLRLERDTLARELAGLPVAEAAGGIEVVVREVRDAGDPVRNLAAAAGEASRCRAQASVALASVPGWQDGAGLASIGPGVPASYERRHDGLTARRRALDAALEDCAARMRERDAARLAIAALVATEAPVAPKDLASARQHRDRGWDLVVRLAFAGAPGPDADAGRDAAAWSGGVPLPVGFARSVEAADRLADRRVLEAASLDRLVQAHLRLDEAEQALAGSEAALAGQRLLVEEAAADWLQALAPLRLGPASTASEVREFLRLREAALVASAAAETAEAQLARLTLQQADWALRLAQALQIPAVTLAGLLADADRRIAAARGSATQHARVSGRLEQVCAQIALDELALVAERDRYGVWEAEWGRCLAALRRPAGETPASLRVVLDLLGRLRGSLDAAAELRDRVGGMERRCAAFADRAAALSGLGPAGMGALRPVEVAERLAELLALARVVRAEQGQLRTVRDQAVDDQHAACDALASAQAAVVHVVRLTGSTLSGEPAVEQATVRLGLAEERRGCEASRDEALAKLLEAGDGLGLAALHSEAEAIGPDLLTAELDGVQARRSECIATQTRAAAEHERLSGEMDRLLDSDGVARASEQAEAASALLARSLDEALVQHAASLLLRQGLAEMDRGGENRLVGRMSEVFCAMTGGSYAGLRVEAPEEKRPARLVAVEREPVMRSDSGAQSEPGAQREIDELSEGSRDQLFLSLRLAAIGQQAAAGPTPPFLADDILQSFDDERALAALRALLTLSEVTQVIVLSHHRHLLDLVRKLPDGAVHVSGFDEAGSGTPALLP